MAVNQQPLSQSLHPQSCAFVVLGLILSGSRALRVVVRAISSHRMRPDSHKQCRDVARQKFCDPRRNARECPFGTDGKRDVLRNDVLSGDWNGDDPAIEQFLGNIEFRRQGGVTSGHHHLPPGACRSTGADDYGRRTGAPAIQSPARAKCEATEDSSYMLSLPGACLLLGSVMSRRCTTQPIIFPMPFLDRDLVCAGAIAKAFATAA